MERVFYRMTWKPDEEPKPVSIWAEEGFITDGIVHTFWEVNEYSERVAVIHTMVGEPMKLKPARFNDYTGKMERVRK